MNEAWQDRAACKGAPSELFFPDKQPTPAQLADLSAEFCDRCRVRAACAMYALAHADQGIWAGKWVGGPRNHPRVWIRQQTAAELERMGRGWAEAVRR